jgi:hypothetical protein
MRNVLEIEGNFTPIFALIGIAALFGAGIGMGLTIEKGTRRKRKENEKA